MTDYLPLDYTGVPAPDFSSLAANGKVPQHVAIVMDGNGRWANQRGLTRVEGHKAGEAALLDVVAGAIQAGVKHLTVYAFSTENWKRSPDEVRFLMGFNRQVLRQLLLCASRRCVSTCIVLGLVRPLTLAPSRWAIGRTIRTHPGCRVGRQDDVADVAGLHLPSRLGERPRPPGGREVAQQVPHGHGPGADLHLDARLRPGRHRGTRPRDRARRPGGERGRVLSFFFVRYIVT